MGIRKVFLVSLYYGIIVAIAHSTKEAAHFDRRSFPANFTFGVSSSAYQYEGAWKEGGRGPSIWDIFTHTHPEKISDESNGDVATDQYHRYKEDVLNMKGIGFDAYRFSISWSRILPNGSLSGGINKEGIDYYNKLIDELLSHGLQPFVTLFHWDTPQGLEEQYGSFLSSRIAEDYRDYVEVCFKEFGDRVKHWMTFNEPHIFTLYGYVTGIFAPGRCSSELGKCRNGDSGIEPYIVAHHLLLAHAAAVNLYRNKFQKTQQGKIGIALDCNWMVPYSNSKSNDDAVQRGIDFVFGWFMDPLTRGDYPLNMRAILGNRLPRFTLEQSKSLKGSFDFIGLNYYSTSYVYSIPIRNTVHKSYSTDPHTNQTDLRNGVPIGPRLPGSRYINVYPPGIRDLLLYTKNKYGNPVIYITENGVDMHSNKSLSLKESLKDNLRVDYYRKHLFYVRSAIKEGVDLRGYFAWSFLDNFEWASGYIPKYGICYVDFKDGLKRYPRSSALWFKKFLKM